MKYKYFSMKKADTLDLSVVDDCVVGISVRLRHSKVLKAMSKICYKLFIDRIFNGMHICYHITLKRIHGLSLQPELLGYFS